MASRKFSWLKALMVSDMPDKAKLIAVQIFNYSDAQGFGAHPGYQRLSDDLGFAPVTVKRYLKVLRDEGWVVKTRSSNATGSRRFADTYALCDISTEGHLEDPRLEATEGHLEPTEGHLAPDRGSPRRPTNISSSTNLLLQPDSWARTSWDLPEIAVQESSSWDSAWTNNYGQVPK